MFDRDTRPLVLVAIGVLLVLNPLYLFPGGPPAERTYELRAEQPDSLESVVLDVDEGDRIRYCEPGAGPHQHRACLYESLVGPDGTYRIENRTLSNGVLDGGGLAAGYSYVYFGSERGFYEPTVGVDGDDIVLGFDDVSARAVADRIAVPYGVVRPGVRTAIEEGSATVTARRSADGSYRTDRVDDLDRYAGTIGGIVEKNGTYYHVFADRVVSGWAYPPAALTAVKAAGVLLGLLSLAVALHLQRGVAGRTE